MREIQERERERERNESLSSLYRRSNTAKKPVYPALVRNKSGSIGRRLERQRCRFGELLHEVAQ
jgi:hypothetical protein